VQVKSNSGGEDSRSLDFARDDWSVYFPAQAAELCSAGQTRASAPAWFVMMAEGTGVLSFGPAQAELGRGTLESK